MKNQTLNEVFGPSIHADRVVTAEIAHGHVHDLVRHVHDDGAEEKEKGCHYGVGLVSRRNSRVICGEVVDRRAYHRAYHRVDHLDVALAEET